MKQPSDDGKWLFLFLFHQFNFKKKRLNSIRKSLSGSGFCTSGGLLAWNETLPSFYLDISVCMPGDFAGRGRSPVNDFQIRHSAVIWSDLIPLCCRLDACWSEEVQHWCEEEGGEDGGKRKRVVGGNCLEGCPLVDEVDILICLEF